MAGAVNKPPPPRALSLLKKASVPSLLHLSLHFRRLAENIFPCNLQLLALFYKFVFLSEFEGHSLSNSQSLDRIRSVSKHHTLIYTAQH